MSLLGDLR